MKRLNFFWFSFMLLMTSCLDSSAAGSSSPIVVIFMVTPSGDGNEAINPSTPQSVNAGATIALTVTPNSGYAISSIVGGSCPAGVWGGSLYTTGAITSNCTVNFSATLLPTLTGISPSSGSASGGTGVTLTGTTLTGATGITFGGVAATSVNVINSTTVTAVSPADTVGAVDVVITTPNGSATLTNGYTYLTTAIGQDTFGGIIACLNGGNNNLIVATADNSTGVEWGGLGTATNATSTTDGSSNTSTIVAALGSNGGAAYAAQVCVDYQIDSQGNTPCEAGNTCYNDWFLPAGNNTTSSGQLNCIYTNQAAIGGFTGADYWSSTESNATDAWLQLFFNGSQVLFNKSNSTNVRCVREFTP